MRYLSVCSGIEAATVAWHPLGWQSVAFSEIEAFPRAVLAHHYPNVPLHGDFTTIKGNEYGAIDLLVGGTPCQSFSVAGLRKGLDDPRGNLMLEFGALARRTRARWLVWENVPGVLSSNGGRDFGAFLGMLAELGYGFAYRVLDAQYFGVAQRRRRVFVVGYLGDWRRPAAVLFERDSLRGNPAPSRETRQKFTGSLTSSSGRRGGVDDPERGTLISVDVCPTLRAGGNRTGGDRPPGTDVDTADSLIPLSVAIRGREGGGTAELGDSLAGCLRASTGGGDKPHVLAPVSVRDVAGTITGNYGKQVDSSDTALGPNVVMQPAISLQTDATPKASVELAFTLKLPSASGGGQPAAAMTPDMAVRRLTPRECERLQGFPPLQEKIIIDLCIDHQSGFVLADLRCLRSLGNASSADASGSPKHAVTVERHSSTHPADRVMLAHASVRMLSADELLELHSRTKLIWSAKSAAESDLYLPPMRAAAIAAELAPPLRALASEALLGKAGSLPSIKLSMPVKRGETCAPKSGAANAGTAKGVAKDAQLERFTTFTLGSIVPTCASKEATWLCSVLAAISGCIPNETLPESFSLQFDVETPYTLVPYRGKPAADGPRYKALGNSMAVPVMAWIGKRIAQVEELSEGRRVAA
ncbi:DNA (cytosine-5-)-methyltransferase [Massilia sp. TS11]|nr:DNA (cytosine-5-)-methyltransferase [Massilia sp. TS11]MCG2586543.1 DNA (cytosine-5-)-methyltransferase [Massilia sp. TS11]